jgi:predicted HicB family RNase H-like nuclease
VIHDESDEVRGYAANMIFDADDKGSSSAAFSIDDIIAFHGGSVVEFEANCHTMVDGYLAASKELRSAAENPASGEFILRIAPDAHADALTAAARSGPVSTSGSSARWAGRHEGRLQRQPRAVKPDLSPGPKRSRVSCG